MMKINKIIAICKSKLVRIYCSSGSMKKYYNLVELCNSCEDIQEYRKKRKKVLSYAHRVADRPFEKEKERENKEIWSAINKGKLSESYKNEVDYIVSKNDLVLYPYSFSEKYEVSYEQVISENDGTCYVFHNGKKLYFPDENHERVAEKYCQLIMEQDKDSPHRYFCDNIPECDVFVDVGSAEGIMSLEAIDKAKEIYLLECSESWIMALEKTFSFCSDKIHIIRKYAGYYDDENTITLDSLLEKYSNQRIVVKMDIEGMEMEALQGCKNVMRKNVCTFSCTTYHTNDAYERISTFFEKQNYNTESTSNFMLFIHGNMTLGNGQYQRMKFPYFRHGVIRATK